MIQELVNVGDAVLVFYTDKEVKEIYISEHMWNLFEQSFLVDMTSCASVSHDRKHVDSALEHSVMTSAVSAFTAFSHSLGSNPPARLCPAAPGGLPVVSIPPSDTMWRVAYAPCRT